MENLAPITFHAPAPTAPPPGPTIDGTSLLVLAVVALFLLILATRATLTSRAAKPPTPLLKTKPKCRWAKTNADTPPSLTKWHCVTCGADGFSARKRPPRECKKPLHPAPL